MKEFLMIFGIIGLWLLLQYVILPKLGIGT